MGRKKVNLGDLVRRVSQDARREARNKSAKDKKTYSPKIFNILEYVEGSWGLNMRLYPAQKFLVKLYYFLPLDDKEKTIRVTDMFNTKTLYRFTEKEYLHYLYNEGRCNIGEQDHPRRDLVLPIGRRGGKCVAAGTLVPTGKGIFLIEDLGTAEDESFAPADIIITQPKQQRRTSVAFYNGGVKDTITVTTSYGYRLIGTPNHRIRVVDTSGVIVWKFLGDMTSADIVVLDRATNFWCTTKQVFDGITLDENLAHFFGYASGEDSYRIGPILSATIPDISIRTGLVERLRDLFGARVFQYKSGRIDIVHSSVRQAFQEWGFAIRSGTGGFPKGILRSPRSVVVSYLRGLFSRVYTGEPTIAISVPNQQFLRELQVVFLNLGIVSKLTQVEDSLVLSIPDRRSVDTFKEVIGFDFPVDVQATSNQDDHLYNQQAYLWTWLSSVSLDDTQIFQSIFDVDSLTYTQLEIATQITHLPEHLQDLLDARYFYDPVVHVETGRHHVYDLSVPDGQSFETNGFVSHNTTLSAIFASYEVYRLLNLYNPQEYYGLPNGNRIQIISVATDRDQAGLLYNDVTAHLAKCSYFKPYIASNTQTHVHFRTPYDIEKFGVQLRSEDGKFTGLSGKASLRLTFKSCVAKGLRGSGNAVVILDEMAHFQSKGNSSAKAIYDAVAPSTAAFSPKDPETGLPIGPVESRVICISSPLGREGKFYELYELAMRGGPGSENLLAIQAPTWEINPTIETSYYKRKYHEDPQTFMVEHGAQFSEQVRGWIERASDLQACIDPEHRPVMQGVPLAPHQMGIDIGLVNDGTYVFITHVENGKIILDYHEGWQAGIPWEDLNPHLEQPAHEYANNLEDVDRLDFDAIADWIEALTKRFYIHRGIFDRWNGIPLEQTLHKRGLMQFESVFFSRPLSSQVYQTAKMYMYDERLVLYDYPIPEEGARHSPFITELLTLQAQQTSKNVVTVQAPNRIGAHDDASDAFVRSVWLSAEALTQEGMGSTNRKGFKPHVAGPRMKPSYRLRQGGSKRAFRKGLLR